MGLVLGRHHACGVKTVKARSIGASTAVERCTDVTGVWVLAAPHRFRRDGQRSLRRRPVARPAQGSV